MAFFERVAHLSRLAFFLSLGIAATIVDACGGERDDSKDPDTTKGGAASNGHTGSSSVGGSQSSSSNQGGNGPATMGGTDASGGTGATVTVTDPVQDAGAPRDADLWDVICE